MLLQRGEKTKNLKDFPILAASLHEALHVIVPLLLKQWCTKNAFEIHDPFPHPSNGDEPQEGGRDTMSLASDDTEGKLRGIIHSAKIKIGEMWAHSDNPNDKELGIDKLSRAMRQIIAIIEVSMAFVEHTDNQLIERSKITLLPLEGVRTLCHLTTGALGQQRACHVFAEYPIRNSIEQILEVTANNMDKVGKDFIDSLIQLLLPKHYKHPMLSKDKPTMLLPRGSLVNMLRICAKASDSNTVEELQRIQKLSLEIFLQRGNVKR